MSTVSEAGLRITVLPAASAAATPPHGMASGKFQGETTTTTPRPRGVRPRSRVNVSGSVGVEAAEVDGFGDLGVALGERFTAFGQHRAQEIGPISG